MLWIAERERPREHIIARHVTMPATSDDSGSRRGDPAISACGAQRQEVACILSE